MENSFFGLFFARSKSDSLYEAALSAANTFKEMVKLNYSPFDPKNLDSPRFQRMIENDKNSPAILWIEPNEYIVYYPPYSTPYAYDVQDQCKFKEVIKGAIFDKNSDQKLFKGDKLKIYPKDNFVPYTREQEAYARICLSDCKSLWSQVCG